MTPPAIAIPHEELAALCRTWHIRKLSLFGSVLRDDFGPDSDVDVLVEFEPDHNPGLAIFEAEEQLSVLFGGRRIDLVEEAYINKWIRRRVLDSAQILINDGELVLDSVPKAVIAGKTDLLYFGTMLEYADQALSHAADKSRSEFDSNDMLRMALAHCVLRVSSMAHKVSPAGRLAHPEVHYDELVTLATRIAPDGFHVNPDALWDAVVNTLPPLLTALQAFVPLNLEE